MYIHYIVKGYNNMTVFQVFSTKNVNRCIEYNKKVTDYNKLYKETNAQYIMQFVEFRKYMNKWNKNNISLDDYLSKKSIHLIK